MKEKILQKFQNESVFFLFFLFISLLIGIFYQNTEVAMWIGFSLAIFSAVGNDSIQSLGTFLSSNPKTKWWILWLFIGGIFVLTMSWGWINEGGRVDFERLTKIPRPENFTFLQIFAPLVLILLTRFKVPVSTTFLILSVFSSNKTIIAMLTKTFVGYIVAFVVASAIWTIVAKYSLNFFKKELSLKAQKRWRVGQWMTTAFLWVSWLMQDTANVAVFLPRGLSLGQFLLFASLGFIILGFILFHRGGTIQSIVTEKRDVVDVRAATLIDLVFAFILVFFKEISTLPMSTTWVFLGLLAGRELMLCHYHEDISQYKKTFCLIGKDIALATIGIVVSIALVVLGRI